MTRAHKPAASTIALVAILLAGAVLPAGAAAEEGGQTPLPVYRPLDPALQQRLDASSARIAALSVALRAAVGDVAEYARLRAEHDAAVTDYQAASKAAFPAPPAPAS
ncbi:MAG TPA: hypothetical protein VEB20_05145 [Azospirillaceae bacterium]|nr:hypothetical protein [Azospirillaceae bacterium]